MPLLNFVPSCNCMCVVRERRTSFWTRSSVHKLALKLLNREGIQHTTHGVCGLVLSFRLHNR